MPKLNVSQIEYHFSVGLNSEPTCWATKRVRRETEARGERFPPLATALNLTSVIIIPETLKC